MEPLITEEEFARLQALWPLFPDPSVLAGTMVPSAPKVTPGIPRILFVGIAPGGAFYKPNGGYKGYEGELSELPYSKASALCEGIRQWKLGGNDRGGGFWPFIRKICQRAYEPEATDPSLIVAWSNLAKIGVLKGNPEGAELQVQADLCAELLRAEIHRVKPLATILLTGDFAVEEILYPSLERDGWNNNVREENQVALKEALGTTLFWTYHPVEMNIGKKWDRSISEDVAKYIGDSLRPKIAAARSK